MSTKSFCENCGKSESPNEKLHRCSGCKKKEHWAIHKKYCKKLRSKEYNVKSSKKSKPLSDEQRKHLGNSVPAGTDVRFDEDGQVICQFQPTFTDPGIFMHLMHQNANIDLDKKFGMKGWGQLGSIADETPTDDYVKLIVQSTIAVQAPIDVLPGVMILSEEDKYYLLMRNGRQFTKSPKPPPGATAETMQTLLSSVIKVEFVMANSNIKLFSFFGGKPDKAKTFHAKSPETIAKLKNHLEKHATRTGKEIQCIRGVSKIYEGYLDLQNLD